MIAENELVAGYSYMTDNIRRQIFKEHGVIGRAG
jgi:hypothetical protein